MFKKLYKKFLVASVIISLLTTVSINTFADSSNTLFVEMVKDINTGSESSQPFDFISFNNIILFDAWDGGVNYGWEPWISDGTEAGTNLLMDINPGPDTSWPRYFTFFQDMIWFSADDGSNGDELWVTDGTFGGTCMFKDINPDYTIDSSSYPKDFTIFNDRLYFNANNGENGEELWVTDGTFDGTYMIKDINLGSEGSSPSWFTVFNDLLFFRADDGSHGYELWVTDGTFDGTYMFDDIRPNSYYYKGSSPRMLTVFDELLFFWADDGTCGEELWVTDGISSAGMIEDINETGSAYPKHVDCQLIVFNDKLFFTADDGIYGDELWVTDGTSDGTEMVKDINPYYHSSASGFIEFNDMLFFRADDGNYYPEYENIELWVTDGTEDGTYMFMEIFPGPLSSYPYGFTIFHDKLFFGASDSLYGSELWVTDGTIAGTYIFEDINPGVYSSSPDWFTILDDMLLFKARDGTHGLELWKLYYPTIMAEVDFVPNTLVLRSKAKYYNCYIELSHPFNVGDIVVSSIRLNDIIPAELSPTAIADHDSDGIFELKVKFNGQFVRDILSPGFNVEIKITGELIDGTVFEDSDYIRVK
jgi:ELWxxDGT repeat protein